MGIILAILGAFVNRCRGGLLNAYGLKTVCKYGNAVVFGVVCGFLLNSWQFGVSGAIGMFIGASFGWGKYIAGIINKTFDVNEVEIKWIDKFVMQTNDHAVLRSVVALSLRGLIWTSCIAIALLNPFYAPIGLLMGIVYYVTISLAGEKGWSYGEWVFGAILWGSFSFIAGL